MPPDAPAASQRVVRLSLLTTFGEMCGIATYSEALVKELAQQSVAVSVLAPKLRRTDSPQGDQPVRIWRRNRAGLLEAWRTFREIRAQRADVVHLQLSSAFFSPRFLLGLAQQCRRAGIPLVATLHEASGGSALRRFQFARALRALRDAELIVHSPDPGVAAAHVIPHGIATLPRRPRDEARRELGIDPGAVVISHFGFIHPDKGLEEVLRAAARLRGGSFPRLEYRVCGGTFANKSSREHLQHLQSVVSSLGLGDAVHLTGEFAAEERVTLEMQAADLVVLNYKTGNRQGASGAAHRALATGCALAVTAAPIFDNLREAAHTLTGPLEAELQALLQSPARLATLAAQAEAFVQERSWSRVAGTHAELYRRALGRPRP